MDMKKRALIVEDNYEFAITLFNYIKENNEFIDLINIASNGEDALKYVIDLKLDSVLLDLKIPKLDGIEFLKSVRNLNLDIFIISGEREYINKIDYKYFDMIKKLYVKPFSISELNDDLKSIYCKKINKSLKDMITDELSNFNFNRGSSGYVYLVECIEKSIEDPNTLRNMEKELFPYISNKLNIDNPKSIKWSLQKLLDSMTRYTKTETILNYFPYTKHPTLKVFITTINDNVIKKSKIA